MNWVLGAVLGAVTVGGVVVADGSTQATAPNTVAVQRGDLSSLVSENGILTFRARPDGSPHVAINRARGIYTTLPDAGDKIGCGDVLYRVDDDPVLLFCGRVPAYRDLARGDKGRDVRQLNRNLRAPGRAFTAGTRAALKRLQRATGMAATGRLDLGDAVFLPGPVRIAAVTGRLGRSARPGAPVARATSDTLEVQVDLGPTQRVTTGDRAQIRLPDNTSVQGTVDRLGRVALDVDAGAATRPASISLDAPERARGLDGAPVQVDITTEGVKRVLSVPVIALVGTSGGGFAVEVVRGGRRELVAVRLGLFDTAQGRVEVTGALGEGTRVVVPSP